MLFCVYVVILMLFTGKVNICTNSTCSLQCDLYFFFQNFDSHGRETTLPAGVYDLVGEVLSLTVSTSVACQPVSCVRWCYMSVKILCQSVCDVKK